MDKKITVMALVLSMVFCNVSYMGTSFAAQIDDTYHYSKAMSNGGDSFESATNISFGNTYSGNITESNNEYFYKFTLNDSGEVNIRLNGSMDEANLTIYDSNKQLIDMIDCFSGGYDEENGVYFDDMRIDTDTGYLTSGTYYIVLRGYEESDYKLILNFPAPSEDPNPPVIKPGKSFETAIPASFGNTYSGEDIKGHEYYKFTINETGKIKVNLTGNMTELGIIIYNENQENIWSTECWAGADYDEENDKFIYHILDVNFDVDLDLDPGTYYFVLSDYEMEKYYNFKLGFTPKDKGETKISTGVTTGALNVRTGPSKDYETIGTLSSGTKVEIVEVDSTTGWYKIKYNGDYAYISYKYVELDKEVEELPVIKTGVTTNSLNVRTGPSTDYKSLGKLAAGTKIEVVEVDSKTGWYKIKYNGDYAYISYRYVKIDGEEVPVIKTGVTTNSLNVRTGASTDYRAIGKLSVGTKVEIVEVDSTTGWYRIKYGNGYGYVSYKYVKIDGEELPVIKTGVTTNSLNVRTGASTDYRSLGKLSTGTKVEIVEVDSKTGWYKIKYGSGYGYVSYKYVKVDGEAQPVIKIGKTTNSLNVRTGPSTSYRSIGKLSAGTKVEIVKVDSKTGWYKIKYGSGYGYVSYKYVKIV